MECPDCGNTDLDYDEVDIGVGVMTGNYRCPECGWSQWTDEDVDNFKETEGGKDGKKSW